MVDVGVDDAAVAELHARPDIGAWIEDAPVADPGVLGHCREIVDVAIRPDHGIGGNRGPGADADLFMLAVAVQQYQGLREGKVGVLGYDQGDGRGLQLRIADCRLRIRIACLLQSAIPNPQSEIRCHLLADDDRIGLRALQLLLVLAVDQEADIARPGLAQGRGRLDPDVRISADPPAHVLRDLAECSLLHEAAHGIHF